MARQPRLVIPFQAHHVLLTGHNHQATFLDSEDHAFWLTQLRAAARQYQVAIHAYVLMPDHVRLLASPVDDSGLARMMQWVGRHYVPYFNRKYARSGSLWQGRFRTSVIDADRYFLVSSLFIELQPVLAGLAMRADDYPWSSYAHHIGLSSDSLITDHPLFWAIGNTPFQREAVYKDLCEQGLSQAQLAQLTQAFVKGWPLVSPTFQSNMELRLQRRIGPARRGRPAKAAQAD